MRMPLVPALVALLTLPATSLAQTQPIALDDYLAIRQVADVEVSPDARWAAYVVREVDRERDTRRAAIWRVPVDGGTPVRLTATDQSASSPRWSPDGRYLAFLSDRSRPSQVWLLPLDGGEAFRATDVKGGVGSYAWAPDSRRLVVVSQDPDPDAPDGPRAPGAPEPAPPPIDIALADDVTPGSLQARPDLQRAAAGESLAESARRAARARFLPEVAAMGGLEWTGLAFDDRRASWMVGAEVRLNLFAGGADRARRREAEALVAKAVAERRAAEAGAAESVRAAARRVRAARAEADARRDAAAQAREAERLVRERYDAGLSTITDLLRATSASLDAEARATDSRLDVVLSLVTLAHALGLPL
ncbi:MAG: TolC family protein [Vicinamibacteria bacterium]